jgi:FMN phosphatase YigB (HAD superfamily)
MKEIIIAFDIDGTIYGSHFMHKGEPVLNLKTVQLMELLRNHIKNSKIIVWSGGGKEYAESILTKFGLDDLVDRCYSKSEYDEVIDGTVDIAFDDEVSFDMARVNLIVKSK